MALPGNLTQITVTIDFTGASGIGDGGYVSFVPPMDILDASGAAIISRTPAVATLIGGVASIVLAATDDPDMNPTGWGYTVTIALSGLASVETYTGVQLPSADAPTIDLSQILPPGVVTPPAPNTYGLLASPNTWAGAQTYQQATNGLWAKTRVSGDTQDRFDADLNGLLRWGPGGSTAPDTTLGRTAAGQLSLNGSPINGAVDWISAKDYGAKGDGVTDDTTAINNALAAANTQGGGTVYLPWGTYLVSATISIPPYVFLVGQSQISLNQFTTPGSISRIVASASWAPGTSTGIVSILSKTPGGWATNTASCGLRNVFIDGSLNANTNLQGINMVGPAYDVHLDDVLIWKAPHHGITSSTQTESGIAPTSPYHHRYCRVSAVNCGSAGFNIVNYTDSTLENCLAFGNVSNGYSMQNNSNGLLSGCRAEWSSGGRGFDITGSAGSLVLIGCTTDQNFSEGVRIHAATGQTTQGGGIVISGGKLHADGNGGTNNNGIKITGSTVPVTITGVNVESGQNANNSNYYPAVGIEIDTSSNVVVAGSILQGITTPWSDGGGNSNISRSSCFGLSGNPNTQTLVPLADFASGLTIGSVTPLGDNGVVEIQLANATTVPSTNPTGGLTLYSRQGTPWIRDPSGVVSAAISPSEFSASPTGCLFETFPRCLGSAATTAQAIGANTGTVYMAAIWLPAGLPVTNLNWITGAIAGVTMTHWWLGLANSSRVQVAATADQTSGPIGASTLITKALTAPYVTTYTGLYYVLLSVTATTNPNATGLPAPIPNMNITAPLLAGVSATTQSAPGTNGTTTYAAPASAGGIPYMYGT